MFTDYEAAGLKLCAIEKGKKSPTYPGWNVSPMPAESIEALGGGAGLLHALSGTCALDVDDMTAARPWLAERGVDIDALLAEPSAVMISSGRPGRAKLIYQLKRPLRTLRPKGSGLELRCATADGNSVQDVLPPSVHPITNKPYEWKYGDELVAHWSNLPTIPAQLARIWREALDSQPVNEVTNVAHAQPIELVRKAIYTFIESRKKDVESYEDWLDVGMRLHEQTGGALEGLQIWDEWSRTDHSKSPDGSPRYKGFMALKTKWLSFGQGGGKHVGMAGIFREMPATADEFPEEPKEQKPSEEDTAALLQKAAKQKKADAIAELEKRLVYVEASERYFDVRRHRIVNTESALQNLYMPLMPRAKGGGRVDPVKALKESSTKTVVQYLGFHPGAGPIFSDELGDKFANTFRNRLPEPVEPTTEERDIIEWLFDRISDPIVREYYLQFLGCVVQRPGIKIKSAPLLWSDTQGNGKTTLVRTIPALLVGHQYSKEITYTQLNDSFTGYLLDAWHINLTEFRAGSKGEREAISKKVEAWIADDAVTVRPMHQLAFTMPNRFFVTASSNADDAASINNQDRKWAICEMHAPPMTSKEINWVYGFLNDKLRAAAVLRHYFGNLDISGFSPAARAPMTADKKAMAEANVSSDLEYITLLWEERAPPFDRDVVITKDVMQAVHKNTTSRPNNTRVGKILTRAPFAGVPFQFRAGTGVHRAVALWNQDFWRSAPGRKVMAHIAGEDVDVDDPLLT